MRKLRKTYIAPRVIFEYETCEPMLSDTSGTHAGGSDVVADDGENIGNAKSSSFDFTINAEDFEYETPN